MPSRTYARSSFSVHFRMANRSAAAAEQDGKGQGRPQQHRHQGEGRVGEGKGERDTVLCLQPGCPTAPMRSTSAAGAQAQLPCAAAAAGWRACCACPRPAAQHPSTAVTTDQGPPRLTCQVFILLPLLGICPQLHLPQGAGGHAAAAAGACAGRLAVHGLGVEASNVATHPPACLTHVALPGPAALCACEWYAEVQLPE